MNSIYEGPRRIGTLNLDTESKILEMKLMFEETVAHLNAQLREKEVIHLYLDEDDEYVVPLELRKAFGEEPVMIFFYLDEHGCHLTLKRASSENAPLFRKERIGDKIRVYALNDEARELLLHICGGGGRAIIQIGQDLVGPYIEPTARPAGRTPDEMYQVSYTVHAGTDKQYDDRETCSREELMDYIENPHYTNLRMEVL